MIELLNIDNMEYQKPERGVDFVYADCIYEEDDFGWIYRYWNMLNPNSVFAVQTDYHHVSETKLYMDRLSNARLLSWVIYKQEWGGVPKRGFAQKHDDILIYVNGEDFHWDASGIQIPKATAGTAFDKKGTGTKTPCSVWDDLGNFSTVSKERIKTSDGKNIQWQKPEKLLRRLMTPFLLPDMLVVDPFMGTGTSGVIAKERGCSYVGIENNKGVFRIAMKRLKGKEIVG